MVVSMTKFLMDYFAFFIAFVMSLLCAFIGTRYMEKDNTKVGGFYLVVAFLYILVGIFFMTLVSIEGVHS